MPQSAYRRGAETLVRRCAQLAAGERAYIVADEETRPVAEWIYRIAETRTEYLRFDIIPPMHVHGQEPPKNVAENMAWADVIFCVTQMSMAHTKAREAATLRGARYLSLPDYSLDLLARESLAVDFAQLFPVADAIGALMSAAQHIRMASALGTELQIGVAGRNANVCPGIAHESGSLGSPPDAEVNIAPVETTTVGIAWIDGSIPCREIGLLPEPVGVQMRGGRIETFLGPKELVTRVSQVFDRVGAPEARVLGEFGIGLNPAAILSGCMLEDEGALGTTHLGFGSNATIGGRNSVAFHLDCIIRHPSIWIDEKQVMRDGRLCYPPNVDEILSAATSGVPSTAS